VLAWSAEAKASDDAAVIKYRQSFASALWDEIGGVLSTDPVVNAMTVLEFKDWQLGGANFMHNLYNEEGTLIMRWAQACHDARWWRHGCCCCCCCGGDGGRV
jgi:hypothetical protein